MRCTQINDFNNAAFCIKYYYNSRIYNPEISVRTLAFTGRSNNLLINKHTTLKRCAFPGVVDRALLLHYRSQGINLHDDIIKWKRFPRYWPFVQGIYRWPVNSPHKGQWRGALMFSLICAWINGWLNNREAGDLKRHHAHCDVTVMGSAFAYWLWAHLHLHDCN